MIKNYSYQNNQPSALISTKIFSLAPGYLSVAPMLGITDRHCRFFLRQLNTNVLLYTEMITTGALLFGKNDHLFYHDAEHPIALQLGGNEPNVLARCAKLAQKRGYDEINLNIGCPSNRAKNGHFGACLMTEKNRVAACISAMHEVVTLPITVKIRIGIDKQDSYAFLYEFVDTVSSLGGCKTFIIHARKVLLNGLSTKENREIPPLDYDRVYQLKKDFPNLRLILNGGIKTLNDIQTHLKKLDGVMMGRAVYKNPFILAQIDSKLSGNVNPLISQMAVIEAMLPYIKYELSRGTALFHITRHMFGLFQGLPGAQKWRRYLNENAHRSGANTDVLIKALSYVQY
ncbi:tRNA-dihydrouridine synthase C [Candidatus Gullanella endobia]|uniref:tRNA-dihydrouridine(20/20a) synthase n=1 Tax=Candidatus Gullanella endobia TaxID=1070130 RepID=A0A143WRY9_9ENTR|nr:tRNA dihydrouridine(20/20a) synthase DusA [Candidatus Gullanella endobia]CUX96287.1 tRNA-dihydrouridine synthase C [Candidatus Gullanella endobia]